MEIDESKDGFIEELEFIHYCKRKARKMNRSKENVEQIATQMFKAADDDDSGELSVIEVFCILPDLDKAMASKCRKLLEGEFESESGITYIL